MRGDIHVLSFPKGEQVKSPMINTRTYFKSYCVHDPWIFFLKVRVPAPLSTMTSLSVPKLNKRSFIPESSYNVFHGIEAT